MDGVGEHNFGLRLCARGYPKTGSYLARCMVIGKHNIRNFLQTHIRFSDNPKIICTAFIAHFSALAYL